MQILAALLLSVIGVGILPKVIPGRQMPNDSGRAPGIAMKLDKPVPGFRDRSSRNNATDFGSD
jgi:hypothetical protein